SREVRPVKLSAFVDELQDSLEAAHTAKQLGREPHLMAEELDQPARADADIVRNVSNRRSGMDVAKQSQSAFNRTMPLQWFESLLQQTALKHLELLPWRWRFQQPLTQ